MDDLNVALDADTLAAYLRRTFPDREALDSEDVSELAGELAAAGYRTLANVDQTYERAKEALRAWEADHRPRVGEPGGEDEARGGERYSDVGALRRALLIADRRYRQEWHARWGIGVAGQAYEAYEPMLEPFPASRPPAGPPDG